MAFGVQLHVWGDYACFTRPEMKAERVSYDVITPSAARGILEAIYWKPDIRWVIDRIQVLKPIRFENLRRNEVGGKISALNIKKAMKKRTVGELRLLVDQNRQQRASTILRDVAYVIEAHFVLTGQRLDTEAKHISMFNRRAGQGQCFHRPCLGTREFAAHFALVNGPMPSSELPEDQRNRDLGWMLHDIDYENGNTARFFRAQLREGVMEIPLFHTSQVKA